MSRRSRLVLPLAGLALAASMGVDPPRAQERRLDPETLDQPPAVDDPREDDLARSEGLRAAVGPYVSVQVNVDALGQNILRDAANEPSIAVNPLDPANVVIGWRQFDNVSSNFRQAGWGYSFDGGATWTFPGVLEPGVFRSDPVLAADSSGAFYYQSLKSNFLLDVFKSENGGVTWSSVAPAFGGDKNWMAVDRSGGIGDGNVYGIWQRFAACCGPDVLTRSTDGGSTFEYPVSVTRSPFFGTLAVGPAGELYAVGADGTVTQDFDTFVVARSIDACDPSSLPTFTGRAVDLGGSLGFGGGPNPGGLLGQANVAVDLSPGPSRGNAYVLASVIPTAALAASDPMEVYFIRSRDGGVTWSQPARVNDDVSFTNWQWFGALDVAPDGRIDAIWYDTRNTGAQNLSQLYYAYSYDEGSTWSRNAVVSPIFDSTVGWPQQNKLGDYITVVSDATGAAVAYAATFNGEQDVYFVRIFPDCNANGVSDADDLAGDTSFDCDGSRVPDECEAAPLCIGAGTVPDGAGVPGPPLRVGKSLGGGLDLEWGPSCAAGDPDYAVYEGGLGSFTSHLPRLCSTGGATTATLASGEGDAYYLVLPTNADREGSLGADGGGSERPPSAGACRPRFVRPCGTAP